MGKSANHSMAKASSAKTSRTDRSRDANMTDAKMAAFSESEPGKLADKQERR